MTRSQIRRRGTLIFFAALLATVSGSCHRSGVMPAMDSRLTQKFTAEHEVELRGVPPATLGGVEGGGIGTVLHARITPALTDDIEKLSDSALVGYLNSLEYDLDPFNNEIENAMCDHAVTGVACVAPESARVFIQPEIGAHLWKHTTIPAHGLIIARIINYDTADRTEREFRFPASTRVWWVVDYDAMHRLRSRYFRRNYSATAPAVVQVGTARPFVYCEHPHTPSHTEAQAKFVSCAQSLAVMAPGRERNEDRRVSATAAEVAVMRPVAYRSVVPLEAHPTLMALKSTWVTCGSGCCATSP